MVNVVWKDDSPYLGVMVIDYKAGERKDHLVPCDPDGSLPTREGQGDMIPVWYAGRWWVCYYNYIKAKERGEIHARAEHILKGKSQ